MYNPTKPYKNKTIELIQQTGETPYVSVDKGIVRKKFDYPEYHHTDGIGTKGIYHWQERSFKNAVIDAMAMNLNDLLMVRSKPYAVIDHLFLPEDDENAILELVGNLVGECRKRDIAITGGETAIHDNMEGLELGITMLGFIDNPKPNKFEAGDVLIGIESNGLHSNGFTKVRKVLRDDCKKYLDDLTKPTVIYSDSLFDLVEDFDVHGMQHITGGAYTKFKDLIGDKDILITGDYNLKPQKIFEELSTRGITDEEMYKTFNCGIGFAVGIPEQEADELISYIKPLKSDIIGEIVEGNGKIIIESKFSDKKIEY